jgi:hypothetical protein
VQKTARKHERKPFLYVGMYEDMPSLSISSAACIKHLKGNHGTQKFPIFEATDGEGTLQNFYYFNIEQFHLFVYTPWLGVANSVS